MKPMERWPDYLWVGLGSACGGMGRYWVTLAIARRWGEHFPYGTVLANVSGSFLIGLVAALAAGHDHGWGSHSVRLFLMAGVLGGYTTFSSFSLQTLVLARDGHWGSAALHVLISVISCLLAVGGGYQLGRLWNR